MIKEIDVVELIDEIDTFLSRSASRALFSTAEVQNMLLDLRKKIKSDPSQN